MTWRNGNQHQGEVACIACPDDERHGEEGGQVFRAGVEGGEEEQRKEEEQDTKSS